MPNVVGTPVTWAFIAASDSATRTVPSAGAVLLALAMFVGTGDTIVATIAAMAPTNSYTGISGSGEVVFLAVFLGVPSGAQTVAVSGGAAGDDWSCGMVGLDGVDVDPFDNAVTDTADPTIITVLTTADGLALGVVVGYNADLATLNTEVFEGPTAGLAFVGVASAPGTGSSVDLAWSGTVGEVAIAVNLRQDVGAADNRRIWVG